MLAQPGVRPTRQLKNHRMIGVCGALLGFLLLFTGIMMLAIRGAAKKEGDENLIISGPICLLLGIIFISIGFVHQYWVHKNWKKKAKRRSAVKKARSHAYVTENCDLHASTVNGIVLGVSSLEADAVGNAAEGPGFFGEAGEDGRELDADFHWRDEPVAGPSGEQEGEGEALPPPALYHGYYGTVDEDDEEDDSVSVTMEVAHTCRSPSLDTSAAYGDPEDYPYSLEDSPDYGYSTEEYDGPPLEYLPPKSFTDPNIFCVSKSVMQVPSEEALQEASTGQTPRYSRYSSKAQRLKRLLPNIKLPKLKSAKGPMSPGIVVEGAVERSPSPEPSTNDPPPGTITDNHVSGKPKLSLKLPSLPSLLGSKRRDSTVDVDRSGSGGPPSPLPVVTVTCSPREAMGSRPASGDSSSSAASGSRPPSSLRGSEKVVRAEVHVSFSVPPDSGRVSPHSPGSSVGFKSPRSLSMTSITDSAQHSQDSNDMPLAVGL